MKRIDGKQISYSYMTRLSKQVALCREMYGREPHLVVIRVGDKPDTVLYVSNKAKACEKVGIKNTTIVKDVTITEKELLLIISQLNNDKGVDGILLQLPLPNHIDEAKVIQAIDKYKDVDGFHPLNVAGLWQNSSHLSPCTPKGIMLLLDEMGIELKGKHAVVVGRSNIVGLPIAKMLLDADATVTQCHSKTVDLASITKQAEILVVAVGKAKMITGDMVKEGVVVIDVGINRDPISGKLCGDVDFDSVAPKVLAITPVPGGVGPMTIACLMQNTIECFHNNVRLRNNYVLI